jgi:hypothetical protein
VLFFGIKPESLGQLGVLGRQVKECDVKSLEIKAKFLRPYGVAYLDQILLREKISRTLSLSSSYPEVNRYFKQVGFEHLAKKAELGAPFPQEDIIKVKRFSGSETDVERQVLEWLSKSVRPFLPDHSPKFWKKIVKNLWEIVHNGLLHGEGIHGVSACGQFYPMMKYFEVAFYDCGHGIPKKVKDFRAMKESATDCDCISWAVQKGNSTMPLKESAGLGLHLLREFLRMNGGIIQIVSGNGYFGQNAQEQASVISLKNSIPGTLVNIRVNYDDNMYSMKGENL